MFISSITKFLSEERNVPQSSLNESQRKHIEEAEYVNPLTHVYRITDKGSQRLSSKSTHTEAVAHAKAILKSLPESKLALGNADGPSHSIDRNGNISKINEEYLDELSKETLKRYINTGGKSEDSIRLAINKVRKANKEKDFYDKSGYMTKKGPNIGASGKLKKTTKKISPFRIWDDLEINLDFDQLDELSKETLNRYKYKNIKSERGIRRNQANLLANDKSEYARKLDRAARNRSIGYVRAYKRLNNEEVDDAMLLYSLRQLGEHFDLDTKELIGLYLDIKEDNLNELSKDTLMSYLDKAKEKREYNDGQVKYYDKSLPLFKKKNAAYKSVKDRRNEHQNVVRKRDVGINLVKKKLGEDTDVDHIVSNDPRLANLRKRVLDRKKASEDLTKRLENLDKKLNPQEYF